MEIGIIGLPGSGKSALFEIMTGIRGQDKHGDAFAIGQAAVPDERFDRLVEIFQPAKVSPARLPFIDVNAAGEKAWQIIRQNLSAVDGFVHVVDGFTSHDIREVVKNYSRLADDLILADLQVIENRLEKTARVPVKSLNSTEIIQRDLLPLLKEHLEGGMPLRKMALTPEQRAALRSYSFWTIRPELVVVNIGEDHPFSAAECQTAGISDVPIVSICCQVEQEVACLPPEERGEFLAALGILEPAFSRIIRSAFELLDSMVYFTVGEDEVKVWVIPVHTKAPQAAAAIHKDFERGFIKAEVVSYEDFMAFGGNFTGVKSAGKLRLEGKEYVVQDGDIISFRFHV